MINLILPAIYLLGAVVIVLYIQWRVLRKKQRQLDELRQQNNVLKEELQHAKTRKNIEQNTQRLSDPAVFDSLQQSGYYRD